MKSLNCLKSKWWLLAKIFNTEPPQLNVATNSILIIISTIEGDNTVEELPEFQNQMQDNKVSSARNGSHKEL